MQMKSKKRARCKTHRPPADLSPCEQEIWLDGYFEAMANEWRAGFDFGFEAGRQYERAQILEGAGDAGSDEP